MARSETTGRYIRRRRVVGAGRRFRIVDGQAGLTGTEVDGVRIGEPLVIGGGQDETTETKTRTTKTSSS